MKTAVDELRRPGGHPDPVLQLIELTRRRRALVSDLEREEAELVRRARAIGLTWQQIAAALDISKQAVHKKYGRR